MKVAIIGSRNLAVNNLGDYLPLGTDEIISGGAKGIDSCAKKYALEHGLKLTEFLPKYKEYGKAAPIIKNKLIVEAAQLVLAFWDGKSRGTRYTIDYAKKLGIEVKIIMFN